MPRERPAPSHEKRVLVLGEYWPSLDAELRSVVDLATRTGSVNVPVFDRAHPTRRDTAIESRLLRDESEPVQDPLSRSSAAICGPTTSTILESAAMGVLTLVVPDPRVLNARPTEGLACVEYARSGTALARVLVAGGRGSLRPHADVMWTAEGLPRWRALLACLPA